MSIQSRNNLAKLLATEDISVEHKNIPTAYFDVKNRILGLPIWKDASKDVYDLLVGHEVGHALFTPVSDFVALASDIDPNNIPAVKSYINVVEDVRIEKKIKRKFPGLRRNFFKGYSELVERDFFGIEGRELDSYSFIDRINLHFKVGAHIDVPFSSIEKEIVDEIDRTESFDRVLDIVKRIYEYETEQSEDDENDATASDDSDDTNDLDLPSDGNDSETDDSDSESEGDSESSGSESSEAELSESETQSNFDDSLANTVDPLAEEKTYAKIPSINSDVFIVSYKDCMRRLESIWDQHDVESSKQEYTSWKKSNNKTVNYLVKGFELKKSATEYARASISKTGVIDTNKIHSYKFNDDLFKRITSIPSGKSHGLLMFLDWSGSMQENIQDTIKQTITLASFCRKVNIPFEIYSFTDSNLVDRDYTLEYNNDDMMIDPFNLKNYLSSKMNNREFDIACWNLYFMGIQFESYYWSAPDPLGSTPLNDAILASFDIYEKFKKNNNLEKVNVVYLTDGASNSKNTVYDSSMEFGTKSLRTGWGYKYGDDDILSYITDPITKHVIGIKTNADVTNALLKHLSLRYGTNVVGFFIVNRLGSSDLERMLDPTNDKPYGFMKDFGKVIRKEKSVTITDHPGYDELYVIKGGKDLKVDADGLKVNADASKRVLTTAFKKNQRSKVSNKVILDNFINLIA